MTKYQVLLQKEDGSYTPIWTGEAHTGVDALAEAKYYNPDVDESLLAVDTL